MESIVIKMESIELPRIESEILMAPFNLNSLEGLNNDFKSLAKKMMAGINHFGGTAFFTIHGKKLKIGQTLRRGGPHTDGNYEQHLMTSYDI